MAEILAYVHRDGPLHRLHPVTKIAFIAIVSMMCIVSTDIPFLLALVSAILVIAYTGRILDEVIRQSRLIVIMSIMFLLITVITMPGGTVMGYLIPQAVPLIGGSVPITWGAIEVGAILSLRFMVLIFAFQIFILTTRPRDLVHTLERARMPKDYILMFIIALRFIPTLQTEGNRIHEAQLARGYNPGTGIRGTLRSVSPIVIPLVSNALLRSNVLGLTIDMRGYRTNVRTHVREMRPVFRDYAATGALLVIGIGFVAVQLMRIL